MMPVESLGMIVIPDEELYDRVSKALMRCMWYTIIGATPHQKEDLRYNGKQYRIVCTLEEIG